MISSARLKRLSATLYVYTFLDDFILLYPVYALLFADTGLSIAQISTLFIIWSVTGVILEVPSGAWADAVSRRLLLAIGPLFAAVGYALWIFAPSYWVFALGFVLWGVRGALVSGAFEALVYEELEHLGAADRYAAIMGRATSFGLVAVMLSIAAAGPVFAMGGYLAVGIASVVACLLGAAVGLTFPEHRQRDHHEDSPGYFAVLRAGLAEARHDKSVRSAVLFIPAVTALWGGLDEYVSLLVRDTGVPNEVVPLLVLVVWTGATLGGFLVMFGQRLSRRGLGLTLALAAIALAAGAISGRPVGIVLVGVAFCVFQMTSVIADARLQDSMSGASRATVTSLAGLGTEVATIAVYAAYAVVETMTGHGPAFALFAIPYLVLAAILSIRRSATRSTESNRSKPAAPEVDTTPRR